MDDDENAAEELANEQVLQVQQHQENPIGDEVNEGLSTIDPVGVGNPEDGNQIGEPASNEQSNFETELKAVKERRALKGAVTE